MKKLWDVVWVLAALSVLMLAPSQARAQAQATTGVIEGTVTDPSEAVIAGAKVTVTNTGTGFERQVTTDSSGFYRAVLLPLGVYRVTVEHPGFAKMVLEGIQVTLGASVTVPVRLKVAAAGEQVVVRAEEPLVGVSETETSAGLSDLAVHQLPTGGRNYLDYLVLTPNVHVTMATDGPQITVNGQKGVQTGYNVDGASANNVFFGEQRGGQRPVANVVLEAVKEFQVVSEGAPPEFGSYSGAFINVVTKSGTNEVHGSLFHLQELKGLTADLADGTSVQDYHREQFGGSIGGPIKKDKFFYFGTFEGTFTRYKKDNDLIHCCTRFVNGVATFAAPSAGGTPVDVSSIYSARFGSTESASIRHTNDLQAFLAKMDWILNPKHTVSARHYFARSIQENGTFDVRTFGRTSNGEEFDRSNAFIASWTWAISPKYLNEFRWQYARENRPRTQVLPPDLPDTSFGPCTEPRDLALPTVGCLGRNFRFGRPFFHPSFVIDEQFQTNENFTIVSGSHAIKIGFNILSIRVQNFFQGFARSRYIFDTVEGFLNYINLGPGFVGCSDGTSGTTSATATCLPAGFLKPPPVSCPPSCIVGPLLLFLQFSPVGNNTIDQASTNNFNQFENGIFAQDKWQARRGLTISYGLRWDNYNQRKPIIDPAKTRIGQFLTNPNFPSDGTVPGYHKAFQPRLGIAWDPWNNGKTVLRANGGAFFARLPALMIANGTANNGAIAGTLFEASFLNAPAVQFNLPFLVPPAYPNCATGTFSPPSCPVPPNFSPFDPLVVLFARNFVYPRTYQGSIWGERQLGKGWAISMGFNYAHATHLNRLVAFNHPPQVGVGPDGRPSYGTGADLGPFSGPGGSGIGIATFSGLITSRASSLYRAFTVKVDRRFSHGFLHTGHYTYSRDDDDDSNERDQFDFQFSDPANFGPEKGPSGRDQRHRLGFYTFWELPWGFRWSNTIVAHSASPRSLLCNFDTNGDSISDGDRVFTDGKGNFSCGPGGAGRIVQIGKNQQVTLVASLTNGHDTGRNRFRRNDVGFDWSTRIQKDWVFGERYKLSPYAEVFNITDNNNFRFPLCDELRACGLGTILQIPGDSRRMRLGLRFEW